MVCENSTTCLYYLWLDHGRLSHSQTGLNLHLLEVCLADLVWGRKLNLSLQHSHVVYLPQLWIKDLLDLE